MSFHFSTSLPKTDILRLVSYWWYHGDEMVFCCFFWNTPDTPWHMYSLFPHILEIDQCSSVLTRLHVEGGCSEFCFLFSGLLIISRGFDCTHYWGDTQWVLSYHLDAGSGGTMALASPRTNPWLSLWPSLFSHAVRTTPPPNNKHTRNCKQGKKSSRQKWLNYLTDRHFEITVLWNKNDFL